MSYFPRAGLNTPAVLQDDLYLPTMLTRLKEEDGRCMQCGECTHSAFICLYEMVSVDYSKGSCQSLQDVFSASMRRTAPCKKEGCKALEGQAVQERFKKWPVALMLFFQQRPVCPAAH